MERQRGHAKPGIRGCTKCISYLNALRLHFAGRFQANVSTVNNHPAHFNNAAFKASL